MRIAGGIIALVVGLIQLIISATAAFFVDVAGDIVQAAAESNQQQVEAQEAMASAAIWVYVSLAVGLLISARASSLRVAMMAAIMATMLPTMILSGFVFPLAGMPLPLRWLCQILPATHFLVIIRGIMLKGQLWYPVHTAALVVTGVVLIAAAVRSFRLDLE